MAGFFATVANVVVHTPIWVWPLYALLLFLGWQRTRDSSIHLARMLILPLVVSILALFSFISSGPSALPAMLAGLVIGSGAGWQLEPEGATHRMPDEKIWLQGEWLSFGLIGVVLIFRYGINIVQALAPALHADLSWHMGTLFISTGLSAIFLGRTAARLRVYLAPRSAIP